MPILLKTAFALILASAALLGGCGGSGDDDSSDGDRAAPRPALTRDQFVGQASVICRRVRRLAAALPPPKDLLDYSEHARQLRRLASRARDQIRALVPPPGEFSTFIDGYLAAYDTPLRELRLLETAAEESDKSGVTGSVERFRRTAARADRIADGLGMNACGTNRPTAF